MNYYDEVSKVIEQALVYPQVAITLATGREDPDNPKQLDLMSMLIMPIQVSFLVVGAFSETAQRLPRYVLLIKELLTYTPEGHPVRLALPIVPDCANLSGLWPIRNTAL